MKLLLIREPSGVMTTRGELFTEYVGGWKHECYTLEDPVRDHKIDKVTAIPKGTYRITLWESPKFGCLVPRLHDVPGFTDVLIHVGNRPHETDGCILVGKDYTIGAVFRSREAFEDLMLRLMPYHTAGEEIWIKIEQKLDEEEAA